MVTMVTSSYGNYGMWYKFILKEKLPTEKKKLIQQS